MFSLLILDGFIGWVFSLLILDGFIGHPRFGCADAWVRSPAMNGPSWHQWFLFEQTCYKEHWWMVHITMRPKISESFPNAMSKLPSPEYLSAAFDGCSFKLVEYFFVCICF